MQAGGRGAVKPPIGVAFDGDLGNRIDAVLALAMLNGLTAKTEARRIALSVSRPSLRAARLADVISGFYAGRAVAGPGGGIGAASAGMVGMPDAGPNPTPSDATALENVVARKSAEGAPVYASGITGLVDTAESSILIRNLILAQNDQNAAIVLAGPATGLARILTLHGSRPQVVAKVKHLVIAAGSFPGGPADPSIKADVAAARKLFAEWPTPIIAVGTEVGEALPYPGASIETDFSWAPVHPVVDAYRAFKPMPYDAPASALAAILYAVHADDKYFAQSATGTITVLDDGRTQFCTPGGDGKHQYLIVEPAQAARITKLYRDMASAPPIPRPARGRGAAE